MSEHHDIDQVSGRSTTGHEWDGIKELNTPLPRWWLGLFYLCIAWAVGYWIVMPAWPGINGYSHGLLNRSQRDVVTAQSAEVSALNSYIRARSNMDLVLGRILEVDNVDLQEAFEGAVKRGPSSLPPLDKQSGSVAAPGVLTVPVKVPAVSALSIGSPAR